MKETYAQRVIRITEERDEIIMDNDGFYKFWPSRYNMGCITSEELCIIASHLDELNKEYERNIEEYFEKQKQETISKDQRRCRNRRSRIRDELNSLFRGGSG